MDDLISRQAAIDAVKDVILDDEHKYAEEALMRLPSAQKTGKWKIKTDGVIFKRTFGICSECGNYLDFDGVNAGRGDANFCPNCGCRMEEGDSDD